MKFVNIKSGEEMVVYDSSQIRAMLNMSDMGDNSKKGQDFGWRVAPEIVVEMELIRDNPAKISEIAEKAQVPADAVDDADILAYIQYTEAVSRQTENKSIDRETIKKNQSKYEAAVRKLREAAQSALAETEPEVKTEPAKTPAKK